MDIEQTVLHAAPDAPPVLTAEAIMQLAWASGAPRRCSARWSWACSPSWRRGRSRGEDARAPGWGCMRAAARDFLDALVALGMLERERGQLRATRRRPISSWTGPSRPTSAGMLEMVNARLYPLLGLAHRGAEDRAAAERGEAAAASLFDTLYSDPERLEQFLPP